MLPSGGNECHAVCRYPECNYAECGVLIIIILLYVVMPNVVMLNVVASVRKTGLELPIHLHMNINAGNTKGGSITVPLTSCLTGLESAV
jgi:hypothetical protein